MEEMYGINSAGGDDYSDKALFMSPQNNNNNNNNIMMAEYGSSNSQYNTNYYDDRGLPPMMIPSRRMNPTTTTVFDHQSDVGLMIHHCPPPESGSTAQYRTNNYDVIKAKIASHPFYPKLLNAYIDCQKVGAPPEIAVILDEIRREKDVFDDTAVVVIGADPELDEFMETYYDVLVKYKTDLSRPIDEATSFLTNIETQLANLCKDDGALSSDEEFSGGETEIFDPQVKTEDRELKDQLLRRYGNHINSLKLEFSKKKKKGKLPKEARQTLLEWWSVHYKWPYPTEADKISLAETTGLDQKQINNWFINQRKRHWKPSENMHIAMMDNLSGNFYMED